MLVLILSISVLAGCGRKAPNNPINMDELSSDGQFHYKNDSLGFSVSLPKEFKYYQTQSKKEQDFQVLEIYVPTSDRTYQQEVSGYGKAIEVRAYPESKWNKDDFGNNAKDVGKKNGLVYEMILWKNIPKDWEQKWNKDMEKSIFDSFKFN